MRHHRISTSDLNLSLRAKGIWDIEDVEAVIIEPTGAFSIYKTCDRPEGAKAGVLMDVPAYRRLVDRFEKGEVKVEKEDEKGQNRFLPGRDGRGMVPKLFKGRKKGEKEKLSRGDADEAAEIAGEAA